MIRRVIGVLAAVLTLALAGAMSPARAQIDEVSALVVRARQPGPPWWRISDGRSTLWIMGVPDGLLMQQAWRDRALERRLAAARLLIVPMLGRPLQPNLCGAVGRCSNLIVSMDTRPAQARPFWPFGVLGDTSGARYRTAPLANRLSPELMERVRKQLARTNPEKREKLLNGPTGDVALWLDTWSWPAGALGNPATERAQDLARRLRVPMVQPMLRPLWFPQMIEADEQTNMKLGTDWSTLNLFFTGEPNIRTMPPEAVQQHCLVQALDAVESGALAESRQTAMAAWANGRVEEALKRSNLAQLCLMGDQPSSDALAFWQKRAVVYRQILDQAFSGAQPGQTVALVEFDPLLLETGGLLAHYRQLGYEIEQSDGMEG